MTKPDVIFKLEQESAPRTAGNSVNQGLPGGSAHSGQGGGYIVQ